MNRLLVILVGMGLAGAASAQRFDLNSIFGAGKSAVTAVSGVDEKDEIEIGRELAGRTLGVAPLVNDANLQSYVNRVGRWIASQSERANLTWHFGVIDHASVNAFAMPGGFILITRGLYDLLDNEAQLAGVLGHEIAHVVKRHHITVMQKQAGVDALAQIAQARTGSGGRGQLFNKVLGEGASVLGRSLDKGAEYEADAAGVVLATRAGYSPYGLVEVLHKLAARAPPSEGTVTMYSTHPQPADRLNNLSDLLTPRAEQLPQGLEPRITAVSARAGAANRSSAPVSVPGARALNNEGASQAAPAPAAPAQAPAANPVDMIKGLKGLFGR